jgi:hypothetical protein
MLKYWTAMFGATVDEDSVLDLSDAQLVDKTGCNASDFKLFVRSCYKTLSDELMKARDLKKNVVISGTPGIGKTAFRNYFVYYLVQKMKADTDTSYTIVLHGTPGDRASHYYVLSAPIVVGVRTLNAVRVEGSMPMAERNDPNLVYLVDVSGGDSALKFDLKAGRTVMFTSPSRKAYSEFLKTGGFLGKPLTMPLWKLDEMKAAASMLEIDATTDLFKRMWTQFGGVPRAVLESAKGGRDVYTANLNASLLRLDWASSTRTLGGTDDTENVCHRLLYYRVGEDAHGGYDFGSAALQFGTDYLLALAADGYIATLKDAVMSVMHSPWPGVTPGVKGDFLEAVTHRLLCFRSEVQLVRIGHKSTALFKRTDPVQLFDPPINWTWFKDVAHASSLLKAAVRDRTALYLRPESDLFPAVDAIVVTTKQKVLLLQVTINKKHPINTKEAVVVFQKLTSACPDDEISLVFGVHKGPYVKQQINANLDAPNKKVKQYYFEL